MRLNHKIEVFLSSKNVDVDIPILGRKETRTEAWLQLVLTSSAFKAHSFNLANYSDQHEFVIIAVKHHRGHLQTGSCVCTIQVSLSVSSLLTYPFVKEETKILISVWNCRAGVPLT